MSEETVGMTATEVTAPPPGKPAAAWEDCLDIFYAPTSVFERRRDGKYWVPLLVMAVIMAVLALLTQQVTEAIVDATFAKAVKTGEMTAEVAAQAKAGASAFQKFGPIVAPVFVILGALITALLGWIVARFMGAKLTYSQGVTIMVLSAFPRLIEGVATAAQGLLLENITAAHQFSFSLNAARFLGADTNNWLLKLASVAGPIAIWETILLAIGLRVIGRMEKEVSAACAIIITLVVRVLLGWA